jgi:hypothetical protein
MSPFFAANGGVPFRRIIIISHAGGEENGPSLSLDPSGDSRNRLQYADGRRTDALRLAISGALAPGGILVFGSCGYYWKMDRVYRERWLANLRGIAQYLGVTVFASPGPASPDLQFGFRALLKKGGDRSPLFGYTPGGKRLETFVFPFSLYGLF